MSDLNKYIIVFKSEVSQDEVNKYMDQVNQEGGQVTEQYDPGALNGFAAKMSGETLNSLYSSGLLKRIQPDFNS